MRIDYEIDFHGYTAAQMRDWLERTWASRRWHGLQRVRVIHGQGEVLGPAVREWCREKGIPWSPESGNPGAIVLKPALRVAPPPGRANRPIARLRHRVPNLKPGPPKPAAPADVEGDPPADDQLAAEFDRLGDLPRGSILHKKHGDQ